MEGIPAAAPEAVKTQATTAIQDGAAAKAAMLAAVNQLISPDDVPAPPPQTPANVPAVVPVPAPVVEQLDENLLAEAKAFGLTPERAQILGETGTRAALDAVLHMFATRQPQPVAAQPDPKQPDSPQIQPPTKPIPAASLSDEINSALKAMEEVEGPDDPKCKLLRLLASEVTTVKARHEETEKENSRVRSDFYEYGTKLDVLDFEEELRRVPNADKVLGRIPWKKLTKESPFFNTAQVALRMRETLRANNFPMSSNSDIASYVLRMIDTESAIKPPETKPATRDAKGMFAAQPTGAQIGSAPKTRSELVSGVAAIMARAHGG